MASTPAEKCGDGSRMLSGFVLEGAGKFSPVNMDSGYYETFSSDQFIKNLKLMTLNCVGDVQ